MRASLPSPDEGTEREGQTIVNTRSKTRLCLTLAALLGLVAHAESPDRAARREATEGRKAFVTGAYLEALAHYEAAYRLKPAPAILFNLAQSHRGAKHYDEALTYYRRYLEAEPPKVQAEATRALIAEVEAERAAALEALEQARIAEESRRAEAEQLALEQARVEAARAEEAAAAHRLELALAAKPAPPPITTRWWFWTGVGVIAVGAAVGVGLAVAPWPTPTTYPDINAR